MSLPHPAVELPKPRKLPKQGRSRMLVESTKQACLQILRSEGHQALTATRISEVAGVAMGSIYQYFPNVDAIVAMVYEDLTAHEIEIAREKWATDWLTMSLEDALMAMIRGAIRFHRNMLALDREFHQRFCRNFDLEMWFNAAVGEDAAARNIEELLRIHQDQYPCTNPPLQALIINRSICSVIIECVYHHPEHLDGNELANHLFGLCFAVLGHPSHSFAYKPQALTSA